MGKLFKYNKKLSILHCTASYPTEIADMNLKAIVTLKKIFPEIRVGLSDHETKILLYNYKNKFLPIPISEYDSLIGEPIDFL